MIEQAMIFTLGFLLAGLAALAIAPAFWRRAERLARRRIQTQLPVSIEEILAERDQLRARNAVECRRLEDKVTALNRLHASNLSELGRRAAKIVMLESQLAARDEAYQAEVAENTRFARDLAEAEAGAAAAQKALFDAHADYQQRWDALVELRQAFASVAALAEVRLASLNASDSYAKDLERRLAALNADFALVTTRLKDQTRELGEFKDLLTIARNDLAKTQRKLELENARATDLEAAASALSAARQAAAVELRSLSIKLENSQAELHDLRERERGLIAKQTELIEKLRHSEGSLGRELQRLQADNAALQGALDVARRRSEDFEGQLASLRRDGGQQAGAESEENAALRQGIKEIGATMIKLAGFAGSPAGNGDARRASVNGSPARQSAANGPAGPAAQPREPAPAAGKEKPLEIQG